jgi:hypothetical protein
MRNLWLIALLYSVWPTAAAHADPSLSLPEISLGSNPYTSIVGQAPYGEVDELVEIPDGHDFIITMVNVNNGGFELRRDGVVVLADPIIQRAYIGSGWAKIRIEGGAVLSIRGPDSDGADYYLQGYLAQAGGPDRFVSGRTPGGGTHVVWTSDPDRDFIARTIQIYNSWCNYSLDGVPISFGSFPFTASSGLEMGRATFVVPAGSSLSLTHGMDGEACNYFIEGAYLQP